MSAPMMCFDKGDRVNTPLGPGIVVYRRMQGPDYTTVAAYSVKLDSRPASAGTPFLASAVTKVNTSTSEEKNEPTKESLDDSR